MGAADLLANLLSGGITALARGGYLVVKPASKLTDLHRSALRELKRELLKLLADPYEFEERAAILEYDAGLRRSSAERLSGATNF